MEKRTSRTPPRPKPTGKTVAKPATKTPQPNLEARLAACRSEVASARQDLARVEERIRRLEAEIEALGAEGAKRGPPPLPAPEPTGSTIDVTDVAELIEAPRPSRV
jgi:hypothetical protein